MQKSAVLLVCSLLTLALPAQRRNVSGGILRPEQACYDVQHYRLQLAVDPEARSIAGSLGMRAKILARSAALDLDLDPRLEVSAVRLGEQKAPFDHNAETGILRVTPEAGFAKGTEILLRIDYGGVPRVAPRPPWVGGFTWAQTRDGKPWIATSCQGEGADLWWPCKDHPSDKPEGMDLHISVPADLYCASNGRLLEDKVADGKRQFHWRVSTPISNYCVALNIAPYKVLQKKYTSTCGDEFETFFYYLPESEADAKKAYPHFLNHLRHMEEICGPYPFRADKYAIVETPHLGMEHQTIIAYGNRYRLGEDGYDWLHHHEMCHEWWANLVTCRDWKDMWIHEGIGTYMQALYIEKLRGKEAYLREMMQKSRGMGNRAAVAPRKDLDSGKAYFAGGSNDIYYKGSWIMHSLRWVLGDEKFFVALRRMAYPDPELEKTTDGSAVRLTDTEEIKAIAEKYGEQELDWFFDLYLHQPKLPRLHFEQKGTSCKLWWETPGDLPFPMPVEVEVSGKRQVLDMKDGKASFTAAAAAEVLIDPERRVLKARTRRHNRR